jgi:hypothetical protein
VALYRVVSRIDMAEATYVPDEKAFKNGQIIESAAHGKRVPVDATGFIDVMEAETARSLLAVGAIRPMDEEIAKLQAEYDAAVAIAEAKKAEIESRRQDLKRAVAAKEKLGTMSASDEKATEAIDEATVPVVKAKKRK